MPNKTIYVADDDLPLYARAQELAGGSLSAAIGQAMQEFVDRRETHMNGFEEVTVRVGEPGLRTSRRFTGRRLVRWSHHTGRGKVEIFSVYRTVKDRYAVHLRRDPDWGYGDRRYQAPEGWDVEQDWSDPATWDWSNWSQKSGRSGESPAWWEPGVYQLDVYDDLAELREHVPPELAELVVQHGGVPAVQDLDI